jgi:hypothetical protein
VSTLNNFFLASQFSAMVAGQESQLKSRHQKIFSSYTRCITRSARQLYFLRLLKHTCSINIVSLRANPESHRIILSSTPLKSLLKNSQCLAFTVYTTNRRSLEKSGNSTRCLELPYYMPGQRVKKDQDTLFCKQKT